MKTLTTLTAAVALIAGMSVASAAGISMGKQDSMGTNSMSKSTQVIGAGKYCTKTKFGLLNCKFASLSACKSGAMGAICVANPHISTTGSGADMK